MWLKRPAVPVPGLELCCLHPFVTYGQLLTLCMLLPFAFTYTPVSTVWYWGKSFLFIFSQVLHGCCLAPWHYPVHTFCLFVDQSILDRSCGWCFISSTERRDDLHCGQEEEWVETGLKVELSEYEPGCHHSLSVGILTNQWAIAPAPWFHSQCYNMILPHPLFWFPRFKVDG